MVVMEKGKIVRSRVDEVRHTGRSTMGVKFATPDRGDAIVAVARNAEGVSEDENGVPSDENTSDEASEEQTVTPAEPDASADDQPGGSE